MKINFKRFAAVISLSLIATIVFVPCAAFFVSAQTTADISVQEADAMNKTVMDSVLDSVADTTDAEATSRAQAFDTAKKNTEETLAQIEEDKAAAQTQEVKTPVSSEAKVTTASADGKYLLNIANPDPNYVSYSISLDSYDRDILEHLVMGEAGGEGFIGAALVAQAIRDTMVTDGYKSVEAVRTSCGYYGSLYNTPNQNVIDAVKFIFDEGGAAVQHTLIYFYAPNICTSGWHESQEFVVEHNSHRFFDRW
ncbi:MAG: hypothetical protein Q4D44_06040 [Eubacteriales bacterium]|nr:hypothetical protein [Eubacteriales bacterium]